MKVDFLSEKGSIRRRVLSEDEEVRLVATAPLYLKYMLIVALHTGMRKGEVLKLKWENVNLEKQEIIIVETKDDEDRVVPINALLFNLLLTLKSQDGKSKYVFINPQTGKHYVDIKRAFTSSCEAAGIEDFHFHDIRHTHASRLVRNGTDLNTVKELLGHSSITTTQRYLHSQAEQKRAAVNSLAGHSYELWWQCQKSDTKTTRHCEANVVTPSKLVS
jgi:integrase